MMEQDPDSRNYGSEEHRPRLPKHRKTTEPEDEEIRGPSGSSRSGIPVANLIAIAVTAALVFLILILLDGVVASPMPELIATIPMFFLDHTATAIARRKFDWPTLNGPLHTRPWYIAGVGYAALLLMVSLLEGALLNAVGGNLSQLGLINIATGVAAGVLIGWRSAGNRPVWTIIEAGFLVGLLGVLFDLVLLGREGSHAVHGRVAPLYLVMVNGLVFAGVRAPRIPRIVGVAAPETSTPTALTGRSTCLGRNCLAPSRTRRACIRPRRQKGALPAAAQAVQSGPPPRRSVACPPWNAGRWIRRHVQRGVRRTDRMLLWQPAGADIISVLIFGVGHVLHPTERTP